MALEFSTIRLAPKRSPQGGVFRFEQGQQLAGPSISCLMVTRGGAMPGSLAIDCYRRQTWRDRELIIVCDTPDSAIKTMVAGLGDPSIRYVEAPSLSLGELRNVSVAHAQGELLCQWDDDDLYHADRLEFMASGLLQHDVVAVFLQRWRIWWPARRQLAISGVRLWEGSMLVRREVLPTYPALALSEDTITMARLCSLHPALLVDRPELYCYIVHGGNSFETRHFETMVNWASDLTPVDRYDEELARLQPFLPLAAYAASSDR